MPAALGLGSRILAMKLKNTLFKQELYALPPRQRMGRPFGSNKPIKMQ